MLFNFQIAAVFLDISLLLISNELLLASKPDQILPSTPPLPRIFLSLGLGLDHKLHEDRVCLVYYYLFRA